MHDTPANTVLYKDDKGKQRVQQWNYRSVIGMITYLSSASRPDVSFAAHPCARFSSNPKRCHEEAVQRIGHYLKRTKDCGMIYSFDATKGVDVFAKA